MKFIVQPYDNVSLGEYLISLLNGEQGCFTRFQASVAFLKLSGMRHLKDPIKEFLDKGGYTRVVVGVDHNGTSLEGLQLLMQCVTVEGCLWVNHVEEPYVTFHPKVYMFNNEESAIIITGSNNITEGGLYTNDEVSSIIELNLSLSEDRESFEAIESAFNTWCDKEVNSQLLNQELLDKLVEEGLVKPESETTKIERAEFKRRRSAKGDFTSGFKKSVVKRRAPKVAVASKKESTGTTTLGETSGRGFVMTLQRTDVGVGQTTKGASRRSPEIFVPLGARDFDAHFWGWKERFTEDPKKPGKFDRHGVKILLGEEVVNVNMMTWPIKHDFRLRSEALRSEGTIGDIFRIEKASEVDDYDYVVEVIHQDSDRYQKFLALCNQKTRNSKRVWGYYD